MGLTTVTATTRMCAQELSLCVTLSVLNCYSLVVDLLRLPVCYTDTDLKLVLPLGMENSRCSKARTMDYGCVVPESLKPIAATIKNSAGSPSPIGSGAVPPKT